MPKRKVQEVIDGDTIRLSHNKFVRLANVNAPELGTKGAAAAKHELEKLIGGKTVSYTEDALSYGRTVGTVKSGSKDVNAAMNKFLK